MHFKCRDSLYIVYFKRKGHPLFRHSLEYLWIILVMKTSQLWLLTVIMTNIVHYANPWKLRFPQTGQNWHMTPVLVVSSGVAISWETILTPLCRVCQSAQCRVIRTAMAGIAAHSHRSARAMHFSVVISLNLCIHCCQIWHMGNSEKIAIFPQY